MICQRLSAGAVLFLLLAAVVCQGRSLDIGDPRAGFDRAPLKVDRWTLDTDNTQQGRHVLAARPLDAANSPEKAERTSGRSKTVKVAATTAIQPTAAAAATSQVPVQEVLQMTLEELQREGAPPTACKVEPQTAGIKWNRGCANTPLGGSCNGLVLSSPHFCSGRGGSIATVKCLTDGDWGFVDATC